MIGSKVAHYEITGHLGSGGMGDVYQATDSKLGRSVAIKLLPAAFASDAERLSRFRREAQVLASLNHPNIAHIYGLEEYGETSCIVMELVEGETLQARVRRGALPVDEALGIARQIADALEAAHEKGVVHRDLKPGNVMLTGDGKVKVLDFGLAKAYEATPPDANRSNSPTMASMAATNAGMILGTAAYMSPEQAKGQAADSRSDIWSFGVLLYEMLAGKPAFSGETTVEVIGGVLTAAPEWTLLPASTPSGILRLIRRCLQKDRKVRLRDIADARFQIEEVLNEPTIPEAAIQPARRKPERIWWIAAMTLVVLTSALAIWRANRVSQGEPETRLSIQTPDADPMAFAISPDGRKLVYPAHQQLWLRTFESETPQPLMGTAGAVRPFWSPDSRSIGFFADGQLKWIDVTGGPVRTVVKAPFDRGGAWSRNGTIIFTPSSTEPLYRVNASGGDAVPVTRLETSRQASHRYPWFLPDGRHFLFYALGTPEAKGVYLGSLDSLDSRRLFDADGAAVFAPPNLIVFAKQGALWAQQFDPSNLTPEGEPKPIANQILVNVDFLANVALSASMTGTLAYRANAGKRQLVWFDRTGRKVGSLGDADASQYGSVRLSPDGKTVLVHRMVNGNRDLWLIETERPIPRRFTFDRPVSDYEGIWSPDGSRIIYNSDRKGALDIFEKPATVSGPETLFLESPVTKDVLDWSPDGRYLLLGTQSPNRDLWAVPVSGDKKPIPIANTAFAEYQARFSPDGHWIAYVSTEPGQAEIYLQAFPGNGTKIQVSSGGGALPVWRRDGRELFYVSSKNWLMAAPINVNGSSIKAGEPTALFEMPPLSNSNTEYDVSLDSQRFLVNSRVEDPSPITVILNWKAKP